MFEILFRLFRIFLLLLHFIQTEFSSSTVEVRLDCYCTTSFCLCLLSAEREWERRMRVREREAESARTLIWSTICIYSRLTCERDREVSLSSPCVGWGGKKRMWGGRGGGICCQETYAHPRVRERKKRERENARERARGANHFERTRASLFSLFLSLTLSLSRSLSLLRPRNFHLLFFSLFWNGPKRLRNFLSRFFSDVFRNSKKRFIWRKNFFSGGK